MTDSPLSRLLTAAEPICDAVAGIPSSEADRSKYLGTEFVGIFVWHIFEDIR